MISIKFDCHNKASLERRYFTGSIPLLTPYHRLRTCGGPGHKAFTSTTTFKKCGGKLAQEGRNATS